jgi:hypothetical protein
MKYPLVLDLAADKIPVAVTCRVLGFSKQAFYAWRKNPVSQRDWDEAHLINAALDIHRDDPAFGYRFIETCSRSCQRIGQYSGSSRPLGHLGDRRDVIGDLTDAQAWQLPALVKVRSECCAVPQAAATRS